MLNPSIAPTVTTTACFGRAHLAFLTLIVAGGCLTGGCWPAQAQATPPAGPPPLATLHPALANVQGTMASLNISRWKVSNDVRARAQQDAVSIQRDLTATLPGLMVQAESPTSSTALSPAFAVLRNLDALYDVLLRVAQTAALGGGGADAGSLEDARAGLEDGRGKLAAWLLQAIAAQDAQIASAPAPAPHPVAPAPAASRVVVEDGPENPKPRKKKPVPAPAPQ